MNKTLVFLTVFILVAVSAFYSWQYFYRQFTVKQAESQRGNSTQLNSTPGFQLNYTSSTSSQNATNQNVSEIKNCTQDGDCVLVRTQCCFNGLESQETCINKNFEAQWNSQFNCSKTFCPMYLIPSRASCTCENSACVLNYTSITMINKTLG
jgi:hypothetical protein